ncbi:MAG: hypothetical protein JW719_06780 [Pirellulales bacterium]|nr:hypothetical protein [Pirellulales bacterium]
MFRDPRYTSHLEKPLAFWALPNDRRLPSAFLNRTLKDLLDSSYSELAATPGVGSKKMLSLVDLLARAADTDPADLAPVAIIPRRDGDHRAPGAGRGSRRAAGFNPNQVSEVAWGKWRASVVALSLEKEPLGRLIPSLRELPCAGWNTPLGQYTGRTLAEIRNMKTHGRKRVRAILEVFHNLHEIASRVETMDELADEMCSRPVRAVSRWTQQTLHGERVPSRGDVLDRFIRPLLEQLETDAPAQAVRLARFRLGIDGPITSAGEAARRMGLTRARVYQLLNMINDILILRWPGGRRRVHDLCDHLTILSGDEAALAKLDQFFAAVELFYPRHRRLTLVATPGKRGFGG